MYVDATVIFIIIASLVIVLGILLVTRRARRETPAARLEPAVPTLRAPDADATFVGMRAASAGDDRTVLVPAPDEQLEATRMVVGTHATAPTIRVARQPARVRIIKGGGGGPFELVPREYVIGRSRSSDIVVDDPSVSGGHARLTPAEDGFTIEDLGSSNGTTVNGRPVQGRVPLRGGDTIAVGEAELRYEAPR